MPAAIPVRRILLSLGLLACLGARAQAVTVDPPAGLREAEARLVQARITHDYRAIAAMLPPKAVEAVGGLDAATAMVARLGAAVDLKTNTFSPQPTACTSLSHGVACLVEASSTFVRGGILLSLDSFYLAWTPDGGSHWYFADGYGLRNPAALHFLFPDYHDNFVLPPSHDAVEVAP